MTPELRERLTAFMDKRTVRGDGCWMWTGSTRQGYGQIEVDWTGVRRLYAHRAAYELTYGPIPAGLFVCHHCDTPGCVRPDHLFVGTVQDNNNDKIAKGRQQRGSKAGNALLTEDQAKQIWALRAEGRGTREIAQELGVSLYSTRWILYGISWRHVRPENADEIERAAKGRRQRKLPSATIAAMKADYAAGGVSTYDLAQKYGIAPMTAWRYVTAKPRTAQERTA